MEIDLKKIFLRFWIDLTITLFLIEVTVVFYVLGMWLTESNLQNDYLLSLIIASILGGFWGIGFEQMIKIPKEEIHKMEKQSYVSLLKIWIIIFVTVFVIIVISSYFMVKWDIFPFQN